MYNICTVNVRGADMDLTIKVCDIQITNARDRLTKLPSEVKGKLQIYKVTSKNQPVLALMSWELCESITATLEILADPELMTILKKSETDIKSGKTIPWVETKKQFSK